NWATSAGLVDGNGDPPIPMGLAIPAPAIGGIPPGAPPIPIGGAAPPNIGGGGPASRGSSSISAGSLGIGGIDRAFRGIRAISQIPPPSREYRRETPEGL